VKYEESFDINMKLIEFQRCVKLKYGNVQLTAIIMVTMISTTWLPKRCFVSGKVRVQIAL